MTSDSISATGLQPNSDADEPLFDKWFDPIESAVRDRIEPLVEKRLVRVAVRLQSSRAKCYR